MSQHDYDITHEDATNGQAFREAINAALQALASINYGPTAPTSTYPCMPWADSTTKRYKQRNEANTAWIDNGPFDRAYNSFSEQINFDVCAVNILTANQSVSAPKMITGEFWCAIKTVTGTYSVIAADHTILLSASGTPFTVYLPLASQNNKRILEFKKIDATGATVTINGQGATIDGAASKTLTTQYSSLKVQCNGTAWFVL